MAGLKAARVRGRIGKGLSEDAKRKARLAKQLYKEGELSVSQICKDLGISKSSLYKYLKMDIK